MMDKQDKLIHNILGKISGIDASKINSIGNKFSSHNIGLIESLELIRGINSLPKDIDLLAIAEISEESLVNNVLKYMKL